MGITYSDPDLDRDEHTVQIAALTPTDNAVIIGNGSAWTAESGSTLRASLGLAIGSDVMAYDADLADWAGVNPSSYLTTAAAAAAYQPLDADLTSWAGVTRASGFDTFAATPTSANLRALITDEAGTGSLYFVGGALGTPASGVLTNCTGLPNASVVGLGTAALVADNTLVHLAGTETITGQKAFSLTPTVVSDPVMTRGAAETVGGAKTFSADLLVSKAGAKVTVTSNTGADPGYIFNTNGPRQDRIIATSGGLYFGVNVGASEKVLIMNTSGLLRASGYGAGTLVTDASGNITASSDERLKTDFQPFTRGITDMLLMDAPVSYRWTEDSGMETEGRYTGFTAQGIQKGVPEAVSEGPNGMLNVQDRPLLATHHNAILELEAMVRSLTARLAALEASQ